MRHGLHMFRQKTSREKENSLRELEGKTFRFVHPSPDAITHGRKVGESSGAGRHVGWGTSDGGEEKLDQTQILDLHYGEAGGGE